MFHYVYRLDDPLTGEFYFGSRSCKCLPIEDQKYKGSIVKWARQENFDKHRLIKTIVKDNFNSREEAVIFEHEIILKNYKNNLNRNYNCPSITGVFSGLPGEKNSFYGKKHKPETLERAKEKRKETMKKRTYVPYKRTETIKEKFILNRRGKGIYTSADNWRAKKIYQYDLLGKLINVWSCAADCVKHHETIGVKLSAGNISKSAKNNTNSINLSRTKNYVFSFNEINFNDKLSFLELKRSDETKKKISESKKGEKNPMWGKKRGRNEG